jgi:hypothetical protein
MSDNNRLYLRLNFHNNSNELFTVQGFDLINGQWEDESSPAQRCVVIRQSYCTWVASTANKSQAYIVASVRLGCTKGYAMMYAELQSARQPDPLLVTINTPTLLASKVDVYGVGSEMITVQMSLERLINPPADAAYGVVKKITLGDVSHPVF